MNNSNQVSSPCNKTCKLNKANKMCIGCGRTLENIAEWSKASPDRLEEIKRESEIRLENFLRDNQTMENKRSKARVSGFDLSL